MTALLEFLGEWGHTTAAALFAALAIWVSRARRVTPEQGMLVAALTLTALWALCASLDGVSYLLASLMERVRNCSWLLYLFVLLHRGEGRRTDHPRTVTAIYGVLGGILIADCSLDMLVAYTAGRAELTAAVASVAMVMRMMVAVGMLLLLHHLVTNSTSQGRGAVAALIAALAAMWTYDLILYAVMFAHGRAASDLLALRGLVMAGVAIAMAIGARSGGKPLQLSRTLAFRSLSIAAVGGYLIALATILAGVELVAGEQARIIETSLVFALLVLALAMMPSLRVRAWLRVQIAKHFFQHRYDYRTEWMRFAETVGGPNESDVPFDERVVRAVADITESPAGLLLLKEESGGLALQARWNWDGIEVPSEALDAKLAAMIGENGWIVDVDDSRRGTERYSLPSWMLDDGRAWALVPLIHFGKLAGAILLARPRENRSLDWEDLDMLRMVGRQVASYIREAQGQQALADAQRFDEFNRRFAFIMHDIKNLVSQLALLARNAERHADNPEFRADMLLSLRESVGRMNELLARLSQHNTGRQEPPVSVAVRAVAERVARSKAFGNRVTVEGDAPDALANPLRFEQILRHLVQNALDASAQDQGVIVRLGEVGDHVSIEVVDQGAGMSAEFIRRELFKPFVSTKAGGFGIGAYEARELASIMNGRLEVVSRLGEGSCFTLLLPCAAADRHEKAA